MLPRARRKARSTLPLADLSWQGGDPDVAGLLARMEHLRSAVDQAARALLREWRTHPRVRVYQPSAANLAAYIALRRHDLRPIQSFLAALGLSSLGRCEGHVMAALDAVIHALRRMQGARVARLKIARVARAITRDPVLLRRHTNRVFGAPPAHRWTRFMVTLPAEAASDYGFVRDALRQGMDCARINCAHDGPAAWRGMIRHVRRAERELGRPCRILMDLGGPKLRTGPVKTGEALLRIKVARNARGRLVAPARLLLDASQAAAAPVPAGRLAPREPLPLAVERAWLDRIRPGERIAFTDVRGRKRVLTARRRLGADRVLATLSRGAWIGELTGLEHVPRRGAKHRVSAACAISARPLEIRVEQGDALLLTRDPVPGEPGRLDRRGRRLQAAHVSCSEAAVFGALRAGHQVWIDDGKIGAVVETLDERGAWLRVTQARPGGERIAPGKGLNFPDSTLPLPALSALDRADLDFAARHADIVGLSFVRSAADLDALARELARRRRGDLAVIAKIETRAAVRNLPAIIVRGAGRHPFGVMIARGDLAVEIGYERLAEIQEEILWLCEAAHVPVIWATQVLEGLVKRGRPTRAEISDAALSQRAECVMLNKGPFLLQALAVLDNVVARMRHHQRKKTAQYRALHW
ncbi:MAG: pyruvate kinase [Betaproteobacteria bacterium]|nr:MAG: pyruvate kinase [Betaproteobacteria bacterium]